MPNSPIQTDLFSFLKHLLVYQNQINNLKKELDRLEKNKININFEKPILNAIISFEDVNNIDNITLKKLIEKIYIGENQKVKICFKV